LRNFEWSRVFTPSSLELGESAYDGGEAGFVVLTVEPCSMPGENFSREDQENQLEASLLAYATYDFLVCSARLVFQEEIVLE
jgi:hypothetical protein